MNGTELIQIRSELRQQIIELLAEKAHLSLAGQGVRNRLEEEFRMLEESFNEIEAAPHVGASKRMAPEVWHMLAIYEELGKQILEVQQPGVAKEGPER